MSNHPFEATSKIEPQIETKGSHLQDRSYCTMHAYHVPLIRIQILDTRLKVSHPEVACGPKYDALIKRHETSLSRTLTLTSDTKCSRLSSLLP